MEVQIGNVQMYCIDEGDDLYCLREVDFGREFLDYKRKCNFIKFVGSVCYIGGEGVFFIELLIDGSKVGVEEKRCGYVIENVEGQ